MRVVLLPVLWVGVILAVMIASCSSDSYVVKQQPASVGKYVDEEQGVVCYWLYQGPLHCVKVR